MSETKLTRRRIRTLIPILIAIAALIVVLLVVIALQPSEFRVQRTASISAPPTAVFAYVNDLHKWETWSPWEKMDPAMKKTFEGPPAGAGATYRWTGNKNVGEGNLTITESRPNDHIRMRLEFIKPFACVNTVEFYFRPEGEQTTVTWSMVGRNNFISKAVGLVMNMDKMVGGQFEQGLTTLRSVLEAAPAAKAAS